MITYLVIWNTLLGLLFILHFIRKELANLEILKRIRNIENTYRALEDELLDILQWIKDYRESARSNRVEATHAKEETKKIAATITDKFESKAQELSQEIKVVPHKIVEILKDTDSGQFPKPLEIANLMSSPKYSDYQRYLLAPRAQPAGLTPADIEGPFYKHSAPYRDDISEGLEPKVTLTGVVRDQYGNAVPDAVLDVWQADPSGKYDNDEYTHRGKVQVDFVGVYRIDTVRPGFYDISEPGDPQPHLFRCAHVHVKVWVKNSVVLTTQLYFKEDPYNATDRWFDPKRVVDESTPGLWKFDFVIQV